MSKIQEIKAAQLAARKSGNKFEATLLTTIIGEAEMVGKSAGNRESTDAEVIQILKKFEKNQLENVEIYSKVFDLDRTVLAKCEIQIIQKFLPAKISDADIVQNIARIMLANNLEYEPKSLGIITKELKVKYGDQFDGKQVSTIFKEML